MLRSCVSQLRCTPVTYIATLGILAVALAGGCGSSDESALFSSSDTASGSGATSGVATGIAGSASNGGGAAAGSGAGGGAATPAGGSSNADTTGDAVGTAGTNAAFSSDAGTVLTTDAASMGAGQILCAGGPCFMPNYCCWVPLGAGGGLPWPTTCMPIVPCSNQGIPLGCDDTTDCPAGNVCCGVLAIGGGSACIPEGECADAQLCRSDAECSAPRVCRAAPETPEFSTCQPP